MFDTSSGPGAATGPEAGTGWCCVEDRVAGPCAHLRELARSFVAEDARDRAHRVRREGLTGLLEAAELGDPEARDLLLEIVPLSELPPSSWLPAPVGTPSGTEGPDGDSADESPEEEEERRSSPRDAFLDLLGLPPDAGHGLGVPVSALRAIPTGADLAAVVDSIDERALDRFAQVEVLAACKRLEAWAAARGAELAGLLSDQAEVFGATPKERVDCTAEEIAMRLAVTRHEARTLVAVGRGMRRTFQSTAEAVRTGRIDFAKARTIITRLQDSATEVAWLAEQEVLADAPGRTKGQLDRDLTKALVAVDPLDATQRHARARARRHVNHTRPLPDGMGGIYAVLPAEDCVRVDLALDAIAQAAKVDGDARTTDQLRADALSALAQGALLLGHTGPPEEPDGDAASADLDPAPQRGSRARPAVTDPWCAVTPGAPFDRDRDDGAGTGPPPREPDAHDLLRWILGTRPPMRVGNPGANRTQIHVTVPVSVLLTKGRTAEPACPSDTGDSAAPGEPAVDNPPAEVATLTGYGPVTPDVAARLAADGTWRRLLTDPATGVVLDIGRSRYQPPAELAALVRARDHTCVRPGCTTPAARCQLDHTDSWADGGTTSFGNLGDLCLRDHRTKSSGAFRVTQPKPGVFVWRTPSGHRYVRGPDGTIRMR